MSIAILYLYTPAENHQQFPILAKVQKSKVFLSGTTAPHGRGAGDDRGTQAPGSYQECHQSYPPSSNVR